MPDPRAESIGIGLVGTGDIMRRGFVPAIKRSRSARIAAVLSRDLSRARALAREAECGEAYTDLREFLNSASVDAVVLASPDAAHEEQVVAAAAANVHVLCSKPMGATLRACLNMQEAVSRAGIVFAMSFPLRSHNAFKKIRDVVSSGRLGRIRYVRALWTRLRLPSDETWRTDARQTQFWAMGRHGAHLVDLAQWLFGEPEEVRAVISNPRDSGANDELAILLLTFASGLVFEIGVSILFGGGNSLEIFGDRATLHATNVFHYSDRPSPISIGADSIGYEPNDPFVEQIENLVAAIRGTEQPISGLSDGVRCVRIMESSIAAARQPGISVRVT